MTVSRHPYPGVGHVTYPRQLVLWDRSPFLRFAHLRPASVFSLYGFGVRNDFGMILAGGARPLVVWRTRYDGLYWVRRCRRAIVVRLPFGCSLGFIRHVGSVRGSLPMHIFGGPSPDVPNVRGAAWTFGCSSLSNHRSSSMILGLFNPLQVSDSTHAKPNGVLLER